MSSFKDLLDLPKVQDYFKKDSEQDIKRKLQAFLEIYPFIEYFFELKEEERAKTIQESNKQKLEELREDLLTVKIKIG